MYIQDCKEDKSSWVEVDDQFDRDGQLHIAINEMIPEHPNGAFKEQCVHLTRRQVEGLIIHLKKAINNPDFGKYI